MFKSFGVAFILVVGPVSIGLARGLVREQANQEKLSSLSAIEEMDPVDFAGTAVLGGLKPLFVDFLWIRVSDAFTRKDWFDALAVSQIICRLQPNLPKVWDYSSWNMSYNIAVAKRQAGKPDEEWQWVLKGIDHQMKGISKNPDTVSCYDALARIYVDKADYDDYARKFAAAGIDPLGEAIIWARRGADLELSSQGFEAHLRLNIALRKKIAQLQSEPSTRDRQLQIVNLAQQTVAAYKLMLTRTPKDDKDFTEFNESCEHGIKVYESLANSTKVSTPQETK